MIQNDGTRERCLDWEARFPDLIRLFLNDRKENIAINGKPTGTANWIKCLSACRGEFVAYCEGDDYWIDKKKISKQVNCFREEADVSICYHRVWIEKQGELFSDEESITEKRYSNIPDKQRIGLNDLVAQGNFIHTPSVMFRSAELNVLPSFKHSAIGDYLNYLSVALKWRANSQVRWSCNERLQTGNRHFLRSSVSREPLGPAELFIRCNGPAFGGAEQRNTGKKKKCVEG